MLPIVSASLLAAAYLSPWLSLVSLVAFVPMLGWIDARLEDGWSVWRRGGIVFGATLSLAILHWMYSMLWVSWLGVPCYLGLAALFTAWTTAGFMLLAWSRRATRWSFAVLLPAFWLPIEWFQAQGDLRMTAQHLAHVLAGWPFLVQFVDVTGPYGVGAVVLVTNGLVYGACRGAGASRARHAFALAGLFALVLAYDASAWRRPVNADAMFRVALVQPNVALEDKMDPARDDEQWARLARLTREAGAGRPDLIVWPETAYPYALYHDPAAPASFTLPRVAALARETGAAILAGLEYARASSESSWSYFNAVVVVRPDGALEPTWTAKTYLVPFVEGIPFEPLLGPVLANLGGGLRWLAGGFQRGPRGQPVPAAGHSVGVSVCFEELYFDLARALRNAGAEVQVVVTNHAWFRRSMFQRYAADAVRMRAIENRTAFIRVANTGISGFVDPHGRYHEATPIFTEAVKTMTVPLTSRTTIYDRFGDVVAYAAMAIAALATVVARRRRPRPPAGPGQPTAGEEDPTCAPSSTS